MLQRVREEVAAVLGTSSAEEVDSGRTFVDLGFTSMAAVELVERLESATGLRLSPTLGFDYPTPAAAAAYLEEQLRGQERIESAEPARLGDDEIAIVGLGCRYPGGVHGPEDLWRLVADGVDAIVPFPADRGWDRDGLYDPDPDHPGTSYATEGGFLDAATDFDPAFFGISPREALTMDPQQRLLLETTWEAFEDAGLDPTALRGTDVGVFAGIATHDYLATHANALPPDLEPFFGLGNAGSVASGRIAYALGLTGPALTVDTACSSSLVAIHLACQSLRSGECSLALAGGATVMASPSIFVQSSRQRLVSPAGRCRSFGAEADGAGWAEGVGLAVLERHADARRLGHEVLALVRGTAVNQDGASNGLAAPSGRAQERVIRQALANAGVEPGSVDAVEGHGTGTALGDPIEVRALLATYGRGRQAGRPLRLGSLKSNIGHSQAAAGIAGVIKIAMAMRHERLPRTLHATPPSTRVEWTGDISLLTEPEEWPRRERPRRAAVSAFGVSGTNAHLILEEPPAPSEVSRAGGGPVPWLLSAKTESSLRGQAGRLVADLRRDPGLAALDIGATLAGRPRFDHRAVVVAEDGQGDSAALADIGRGEPTPRSALGLARERVAIAFVLPGHGSQWPLMARDLLAAAPPFAARLRACDAAFRPHLDWSIERLLAAGEGPPLDRVDVVQPALFATTVALAELWRSVGVEPDFLVGHSLGEVAAAHLSGALDLDDAALVVAARSRALAELAGEGTMALLALSPTAARERIAPFGDALCVGAVNGPAATVISGDGGAIEAVLDACAAEGIWARRVPVAYPAHSPRTEAGRERLLAALEPMRPRATKVPLLSTVTAAPIDGGDLGAEYWHRNVREPVRFAETIRAIALRGCHTFVEVSPHPTLTLAIEETLEEAGIEDGRVLGTMRRDDGGLGRFLTAAGEAYVEGVEVSFDDFLAGGHRRRLSTYAFDRSRFWIDPPAAAGPADPPDAGPEPSAMREAGVDLVRRAAASILGHADAEAVDPDRSLFDLGLDSLGAVELRTRVEAATGRRVPVAALLDAPTARGLGTYLDADPSEPGETAASSPAATAAGEPAGTADRFAPRLLAARDAHAILAVGRELVEASRLLPTFESAAELPPRRRTVPISAGPELPRLICVPSFLPGSGPQQFARLAAAFARTRPIAVVRLPGLEAGEPVPASRESAVAVLVEAVLAEAGSEPFALAGYSAGGTLVHAIGERLDREATRPRGLILIDTYEPRGEGAVDAFAAAMAQILARTDGTIPIDDEGLLAMGAYLRLLDDWEPTPISIPSLLLAASTALGSAPRWTLADEAREIGGDHFSVIEARAAATAEAGQEWIEALDGRRVARTT
jgi:acyl transferase domain-containing protein